MKPFDVTKPIQLFTDASDLGVGYALLQPGETEGQLVMVKCGSRPLTPAEKNYSVSEKEALAIYYAVRKSEY